MADSVVPLPFVNVLTPAIPAGQPVPAVLIHGWASGSVYWEPLAKKLLDAGREVWIVDLPGYHPGEELPPDFEWTLDSAAASVAAALDARSPAPAGRDAVPVSRDAVHLVGHSMGGSVSLTLAAARPDLVASLTLVGMAPVPQNQGFKTVLSSQLDQGFFDSGTIAKLMHAWYGELPAADMVRLSAGFSTPFPVLSASAVAAMSGVEPSVPGRVHAPLMVIAGTEDRVRPMEQMRAFVAESPARRLKAIPGAGHNVHWEQPEHCAQALAEFWETSWPPPA
ncbi:alpha/beta fold hydrolase [Arthrobacter sp. EpRS71]|uniref:alpha/beta fold hydrolase n=1 Tax=Arthrobacter sp. EpRS71 TaxID=1743141 RepID=UPI0007490EEA|nr:alpha/beta fold hydrolase [Arthrobacter sp. EpRS71]KUM34969.1 alpha/beta hydrolase [Arthrobacter sp. EpRS71]